MKILVVTQYFWPENFRVNDLVNGLVERGHEVTVFTGLPNYPDGQFFKGYGFKGPYFQKYNDGKVNVVRVPLIPRGKKKGVQLALNYFSFAFFGCLLAPFLCRGKFDRIFVYEVSPVTVALPAIVLKFFKRIPIYFWVTDLWPETLIATNVVKSKLILGMVAKLVQFIYKNCDYILVSSKRFIEKVEEQKVNKDKIIYFPYWAEKVFYQQNFSKEDLPSNELPEGFKVMFAGNIGTSQSFDTIVEAASILKAKKEIHWVVIGDGLQKKWLSEEIKKRKLVDNFHLLGRKPLEIMPRYYHLADVLLISLKKDPLFSITVPGKVQSCLASGRPIIGSIDGEGAKIIEESGSGFAVEASNSKKLAEAVLKMYKLPHENILQMQKNAKQYFLENFEREKLLSKLEEIMQHP